MKDHAATDALSLALQWLERPADWPQAAAALYDAAVCWRAPARGLLIEGRDAVLAQLRDDARRFAAAEPVVLRRVVAGARLIDESALTFICPADGVAGVTLTPGDRIELKRTRLLSFAGGLIVDELNLETWTVLQR
ncbi:hypothetical protein [Aquabacterium sp.]|uniref:hypothetical protein n=1 Tax=Aquabacterium sp. TaxID=1872578 RepID=UPI002C1D2B1E|nr:hypothetical protein [Aquabacterium sp.]HSW04717.1 hypothetical protein [Aquabacterium sp.]